MSGLLLFSLASGLVGVALGWAARLDAKREKAGTGAPASRKAAVADLEAARSSQVLYLQAKHQRAA